MISALIFLACKITLLTDYPFFIISSYFLDAREVSFVACIASLLSRFLFFFPPVSLIWVSVFLYLRGGTSMLIGNSVPMGRGSPLARVIRCGCDIFIAQNSAVPCPGLYILGC